MDCIDVLTSEENYEALPPAVQAQLRAITGLRTASQTMGLGGCAFDDAAEFIAMLRENVALQKERLAESTAYRQTHAPARAGLGRRARTGPRKADQLAWRRGMETRPLHAAQKRLAFAGLLRDDPHTTFRALLQGEIETDVASCVAELVVANDRESVLLAAQCRRVWELEKYTATQIGLLKGLTAGCDGVMDGCPMHGRPMDGGPNQEPRDDDEENEDDEEEAGADLEGFHSAQSAEPGGVGVLDEALWDAELDSE